ncbi:hypothetical protein HK405_005633, partial [Cladochytrium tenue]
ISQGLEASKAGTILAVPVLVDRPDNAFSFKLAGQVSQAVPEGDHGKDAFDALLKLEGERLNPSRVANFIPRIFQIRKIALDLAFTGIGSADRRLLTGDEVESLRAWLAPAYDEVAAERARLVEQYVQGTRAWLVAEVEDFVAGETDVAKRVMWIKGQAGVGKSVISALVADRLQQCNNLGAVFFCKHGDARLNSAYTLIRTVAFSLCQWSPAFARHLLAVRDAADSDPDSVFRCSPSLLFSRLVTDPLCEIFAADGGASSETVVLLVDALDECGSADARGDVLAVFARGFEALPGQVKIVFTSRPDGDIVAAMAATGALERHIIPSDANGQADAQAVASRGVRAILKRRAGLPPFSPSTALDAAAHDPEGESAAVAAVTDILVEKSGGLLVWLAVALRLLEESNPGGAARDAHGGSAVAAAALAAAAAKLPVGLASLHASVFRRAFGHRSSPRLSLVVGLLAVAREPLTSAQVADIADVVPRQAEYCLGRLRAVLATVATTAVDEPASAFNHKSVTDYLSGKECTDPRFRVYEARVNMRIALLLLELLNARLQMGVSHSSMAKNEHDDGLPKRSIDASLSYACRAWAWHVPAAANFASPDAATALGAEGRVLESLISRLHDFATTHLLHWIEAMTALQCYDELGSALSRARAFLDCLASSPSFIDNHGGGKVAAAAELFSDALRVVSRFRTPIVRDPMQVYYSAIPLCPTETRMFRTYAPTVFAGPERAGMTPVARSPHDALFPVLPPMRVWDAYRCAEDVGLLTLRVEFATVPAAASEDPAGNPTTAAAEPRTLLAVFATGLAKVLEVLPGGSLHEVLRAPMLAPTMAPTRAYAVSRRACRLAIFSYDGYSAMALRVWEPSGSSPRLLYALIGSEDEDAPVKRVGALGKLAKAVKSGWKKMKKGKLTAEMERLGPESVREKIITALEFSNDETVLLAGTKDGCIIAWDVRDDHNPLYLGCQHLHRGAITDLAVAPGDTEIYAASADGLVKIFSARLSLAQGEPVFVQTGQQAVPGVTYLSLSFRRLLTSGSQRATLWAVRTAKQGTSLELLKEIPPTDEGDLRASFSPKGTYIAVRHQMGVLLYNDAADHQVGEIHQSRVYGYGGAVEFAFSEDEEMLATGADVSTLTVWNVKDAVATFVRADLPDPATTISVLEVTCDEEKTELANGVDIHNLTVATTKISRPINTRASSKVFALNISDAGRSLVATDGSTLTRLWDLETQELLLRTTMCAEPVSRPSPSVFVAKRAIWTHPMPGGDGPAPCHAFRFTDQRDDRWTRVAIAPDGTKFAYLAAADAAIRVVDVPTKRVTARFAAPADDVLAISPNGSTLALADPGGRVTLWDADSGRVAGAYGPDPAQNLELDKARKTVEALMPNAWELLSWLPNEPRAIVFAQQPAPAATGRCRLVFTITGINVLLEAPTAPSDPDGGSGGALDQPRGHLTFFNHPLATAADFSTALAFSADAHTLINLCIGVVKVWVFDSVGADLESDTGAAPRLSHSIRVGDGLTRQLVLLAPDASLFVLGDRSVWETTVPPPPTQQQQLRSVDEDGGVGDADRRCVVRFEDEWVHVRGRPPMWLPQGLRGCSAFDPRSGLLALGGTELVGAWRL